MFDDLQAYFQENCWVTYENYVQVKGSIKKGMSRDLRAAIEAATPLFHLREHIPPPHRKEKAELRQICPDYGLLEDVVNAAKHGTPLTHGNPQIVGAKNIYEATKFTMYKDEQGDYWHSEKVVYVELKDGSKRDLYEVLTNVINMWLVELHSIGVIPHHAPFEMKKVSGIPPRTTEHGSAYAETEIIPGVRYRAICELYEYDYEVGAIVPFKEEIAKATLRIYKSPLLELNVATIDKNTGEETIKTFPLSEEQSARALRIHRRGGRARVNYNFEEGKVEIVELTDVDEK